MNYEDLPEELRKELEDAISTIELVGENEVDIPATLTYFVLKAFDMGWDGARDWFEQAP